MHVELRRLTSDDLPMLHAWLNEPGIVRWWEGDDVSWDAVVRDYGGGDPRPEHWLGIVDGEPIGWIQCYAVADYLDDPAGEAEAGAWLRHGLEETAAGIDYLVADPRRRGHGLGTALIRTFVDEVVFGQHPGWTSVWASPQLANVASWRALASAGFEHVADYDDPVGRCRIMRRPRPTGDDQPS